MVPTVEDIVVVVMEDMVVDTGEFSFEKNCCSAVLLQFVWYVVCHVAPSSRMM